MKHVFLVNSHTTFFSAVGVVNYMGLNEDDVIYLTHRNYRNSVIETCSLFIDFEYYFLHCDSSIYNRSLKEKKQIIRSVDCFIDEKIGDFFHLYGPHLGNPVYQILYTNTKCLSFSYVQEGAIIYNSAFITDMPKWRFILHKYKQMLIYGTNRIWNSGYYMNGRLFKNKELHSFALNDDIYKNLPSINHIISWPTVDMDFQIKENSVFFILDGFIKNGMVEPELYLSKVNDMVRKYAGDYNYLKFHPNEVKTEREAIVSFFTDLGLKYEVIEDSVPFELFLTGSKKLNVVGIGSSLLYFARDLGHNSICLIKWLKDSELYSKYKKNVL